MQYKLILVWLACLSFGAPAFAQPKLARVTAVDGALWTLAKDGWKTVAVDAGVLPGYPLVALFGAEIQSPNGNVTARMIADVGQRGPFPVLESAIRVSPSSDVDFSVALDRGILVLTNTAKKGPAKVHLSVEDTRFEIVLPDNTARVGIERYGRHVPGPVNVTNAKEDVPVINLACFALAGEATISTETQTFRLHAPPGNALLLWDNLTEKGEVQRFEMLPEMVKPMDANEKKKFDAISAFAKGWLAKNADIGATLEQATRAQDAKERRAAVVALGALDDLPRLLQALTNKDHADARDISIVVLRHWLGRQPGQTIRLYQHLTKTDKLTATQAKNFIYMLKGIEEEKRRDPITYDLLIQALNHSNLAVRELARWHLVRLAPAGKDIPYDAASPEAQRLEAVAAWRRLIPDGELPPPPKKKAEKP